MDVDWRNPLDRAEFEKSLEDHRGRRSEWSGWERLIWLVQIFLLPLLVIALLYGGSAYYLVQDELKLRSDWSSQVRLFGIFSKARRKSF